MSLSIYGVRMHVSAFGGSWLYNVVAIWQRPEIYHMGCLEAKLGMRNHKLLSLFAICYRIIVYTLLAGRDYLPKRALRRDDVLEHVLLTIARSINAGPGHPH